jgi:hypothetical protein
MRHETPWGTWDHITLDEVVAVLDGLAVPWWIAGGYAIDAFAGSGRRDHDDIDVSLFHADHLVAHVHLSAWDLHCAENPPGILRSWLPSETLGTSIHDIWVRRDADDAWRFQLMLNGGGPSELVFRRDERVRAPLERATFVKKGVRYMTPEWQLLFKSRGRREKDEFDFRDCLPLMSTGQRAWLRDSLGMADPENPWLARL